MTAGGIRAEFRGAVGRFALDAAFTAPSKGVTALFGPSGSGKTTILRCIAGLTRMSDGVFEIDGERWQDRNGAFLPTCRRPLGFVFQEASLFPHLSVRRNLLFGAPRSVAARHSPSRDGRPSERPTERGGPVSDDGRQDGCAHDIAFEDVVDLLGVTSLLDRSPRYLSGGERQRVAIGRALLSQPKLLLMDEPLSALDRATKDEIMPFLERLHARLSLPILYVSHDIAEVERLADRIVLMNSGRVVASGPLADLESDPQLPLAMAREAAVTLDAVIDGYDPAFGLLALKTSGGRFVSPARPAPIGEHRRVRVVARDVSLARERPGPSSILNILPGRILAARALDSNEMLAVVALGAEGQGARLLSRLTRKSWALLGLAEGMQVYAQVKAVALGPRRGDLSG